MLVTQGPTDVVLNQHRQGLAPWSSEHENSPLSSFLSSILYSPLIAPHGLILNQLPSIQILNSIHVNQ
jgi:hypothetical protein